MMHFLRQIISDLIQSCHNIALSHFKTYRINCHFYVIFFIITLYNIHVTCVVFLAAHRYTRDFKISIGYSELRVTPGYILFMYLSGSVVAIRVFKTRAIILLEYSNLWPQ